MKLIIPPKSIMLARMELHVYQQPSTLEVLAKQVPKQINVKVAPKPISLGLLPTPCSAL